MWRNRNFLSYQSNDRHCEKFSWVHVRSRKFKLPGFRINRRHKNGNFSKMNRENVAIALDDLWAALEITLDRSPHAIGKNSLLRRTYEEARKIALTSCASYQTRGASKMKEIASTGDREAARNFISSWLTSNLSLYSPSKIEPKRATRILMDFILARTAAKSCGELADFAAHKYCVLSGIHTTSVDAFYIEVLVREAMGLPGDTEVRLESFPDQFFLAELVREIATKPSIPESMVKVSLLDDVGSLHTNRLSA